MKKFLAIGDNTVDIYIDRGIQFPGGNAVNVAVYLKRLGIDSAYLGCLGSDDLGDAVKNALIQEGVNIERVRITEQGNAWAKIGHKGNDRIFKGSNPVRYEDYRLTDQDYQWISAFDFIHSSVYSKLEPELSRLKETSVPISFDYSSEFVDEYIAETAPFLSVAFLSDAARSLDECKKLAQSVACYGPALVVITRGEKGAVAIQNGEFYQQDAVEAKVTDTLGAGDGFIAGVLCARLMGKSIAEQLYEGACYAGKICEHNGAFGYQENAVLGQEECF